MYVWSLFEYMPLYVFEHCILVCSDVWLASPPVCRRLDPSERPLQMVYEYLTAMGYEDPLRVQQEAANSDLSCMIRFYSGELWAGFSLNAGTASSVDQAKIPELCEQFAGFTEQTL